MQSLAQDPLPLLRSPEHPCPYLPGKTARAEFLDLCVMNHSPGYAELLAQGFRRSGMYFYRPDCKHCHACVPLRVPVREFNPDRSQRRVWQRNQDLTVSLRSAEFIPEHYALYRRYLAWKHAGGGMDDPSPLDYASLLMARNHGTLLAQIHLHDRLIAVAVVDALDTSWSAVYTFYTPETSHRSLGTFAILWEIAEARRRGLQWLYLGYWVEASPKMSYKARFLPHEHLSGGGWQRISRKSR